MKISGGKEEDGIVVGNTFDKYSSKNPIVNGIMQNFHGAINQCVQKANPKSIYEIGCGEGYWVMKWNSEGLSARGSDFSTQAIDIANENSRHLSLPEETFSVGNIYDLGENELEDYDLVVCCEVLEHLEEPEEGLKALARSSNGYFLLSVPKEPIWRVLNLARGKYIMSLGNTPGHLQHWSKTGFRELISDYFDIVSDESPFPWTMFLCSSK